MNENNDIYAIAGRVKNIIARDDIAISPVGQILVNYYVLVLKDLYDFASTLKDPIERDGLIKLLASREDMPKNVIKVGTPSKSPTTLFDVVLDTKAEFGSASAALDCYMEQYENLAYDHNMSGDDFWAEAESSLVVKDVYQEIMRLKRCINMCEYLITKEKIREEEQKMYGELEYEEKEDL